MYKVIKEIISAPLVNMGPIKLRQAIPTDAIEQISPFILLHHFDFTVEPGDASFNVPPHPHRGFMPITFMFDGNIQHEDSLGNLESIGRDEVQWISAAKGIIHSEKIDKKFLEQGGRFQGIQLWINLPSREKLGIPSYQAIKKDNIELQSSAGVEFRLISGTYKGKIGPAHSNVITAMLRMGKDSHDQFTFESNNQTLIYILEGNIVINKNKPAKQHDLISFEFGEGDILINANENSVLLMLSGKPILEPLVSHGPFVMNSETEIMEAMRDYQQGKMGYLSY